MLKIDKSFIDADRLPRPQQRALVEGIVRLARTLGLEVVAEGIETARTGTLLVAHGLPSARATCSRVR